MSKTFNLLHLLQAPPVQPNPERLVPFHILIADHLKPAMTPLLHPIGHISFDLLAGFNAFNNHLIKQLGAAPVFDLFPARTGQLDEAQLKEVKCVAFKPEVVREGVEAMSKVMDHFVLFLHRKEYIAIKFYPKEDMISVFADARSAMFGAAMTGHGQARDDLPYFGNVAFRMIRSVMPKFKMIQMGVHMVVYEGEGKNMKIWCQKRAPGVQWPGKLDSTAGGAVETGLTAVQALCKEADEECGYSSDLVRKYAKCTGALPVLTNGRLTNFFYEFKRPDADSVEYEATAPHVVAVGEGEDEECAGFELLAVDEVITKLQEEAFQPTTPAKLIHFLIRHGIITKENDEQYDALVECLHARIPVPLPHRFEETIDTNLTV